MYSDSIRRRTLYGRERGTSAFKERNRIERFINRMKQFRRIATRYEKLAETFIAFLHIIASYVAIR
ncbi:transposase [bacterium]|nr:transposase [bacterium]